MKRKRKQYTMSDKRKLRDAKQANWSRRMRIVELRDENGFTFKEIARLMGCTLWNASKLYKKAKQQLPQEIGS